jgi:hypothetical protein
VSNDEVARGVSIPLDADGFVRRECPTCEREFKWLYTSGEEEGAETVADGGYFCPYCGVQAPGDAWLTQAQVALIGNMVEIEVVGPMIKSFADVYDEPDRLDPLTEDDNMMRVDFACHPSEPLKVLADWRKAVRCLICGEPKR